MLVNQHNPYVLPLGGELVKGGFDGRIVGLVVHNKEVLLRVWRSRDVL